MKKQKKLHSFIEELVLALCTIIMLVPIYYLVLGAFKDRKDIIKYPLLLTKELFTLENFPYVINKMKYWQALANTVTITPRVAGHRHHLRVAGRLCHRPDPQQAFPRLLQRARHADGHPVHRLPAPADRTGHAPWHLRLHLGLYPDPVGVEHAVCRRFCSRASCRACRANWRKRPTLTGVRRWASTPACSCRC